MRAILLSTLALLSLAHAEYLEQRQSTWTVGQTVQTGSGPVNGHAASNATQVSEYLGIPFAAPPVGDLRFAAPQNYTGNSTINGTSFVRHSLAFRRLQKLLTQRIGVLMPGRYNFIRQYNASRYCECQYYSGRTPGLGISRSSRR